MKSLVSVIIPCYKQANFLPEAVESVVNQSYTNWECIIVNDGSPDNTSDVARSLIERYPDHDISLVEKNNGGLADARNAGIALARGKYIQPLDSDDILEKNYLEVMVAQLQDNKELNAVYCLQQNFGESEELRTPPEFDKQQLLEDNCMLCSTLFEKQLWQKSGGYYTGIPWGAEDWNFWISCLPHGLNAKRIDQGLFLYRVSKTSMFSTMIEYMPEVRAFIKTLHPDLYSKDQLDSAYLKIMKMRDETLKKITEIKSKFPNDEYLYFWVAIYLEGKRNLQQAKLFYKESLQCLENKNIQNKQIERRGFELEQKLKAIENPEQDGPMVSVIVPTFNRKESLKKALLSVAMQTYRNIEVVVVNDCGEDVQDMVEEICSQYSRAYKYICHSQNKGLATARNTGIKNCSSDYLAYLDDDDLYYENHLAVLMTYLKFVDADVVYADANVCIQKKRGESYQTVNKSLFIGADFSMENMLVGNFIPVQCFLQKKECVEDVGGFDENLDFFEDWDLWIRLSQKVEFKHIACISSEFYVRRDESSMTGSQKRADKRRELIYNKHRDISIKYKGVRSSQKQTLIKLKKELINKLQS